MAMKALLPGRRASGRRGGGDAGDAPPLTRVLFLPDWRNGNPYQTRLSQALAEEGFAVSFADYPGFLFALSRMGLRDWRTKIVHIHWLSSWVEPVLWSGSALKFKLKLVLIALDLLLLKAAGCRVFWTVHNLVEHTSLDPKRERALRRLLARFCDGLLFHSQSAVAATATAYGCDLAGKAVVAPHGSYADDYPADDARAAALAREWGIGADHFTFLFFGAIRRYKGVEQLLEAFSRLDGAHYRLILAGRVIEPEEHEWLEQWRNRDPRIRFQIGFIPDSDVAPLLSLSKVLVLPYTATLSSGVVSLGLAFGMPMLLSEQARVYDVPGEQGARYFKDGELTEALAGMAVQDLAAMRTHNAELGQQLTWPAMARAVAAAYRGKGAAAAARGGEPAGEGAAKVTADRSM